jgi:hypothetical protein
MWQGWVHTVAYTESIADLVSTTRNPRLPTSSSTPKHAIVGVHAPRSENSDAIAPVAAPSASLVLRRGLASWRFPAIAPTLELVVRRCGIMIPPCEPSQCEL